MPVRGESQWRVARASCAVTRERITGATRVPRTFTLSLYGFAASGGECGGALP
jgi:hypothetical protein